MKYPRRKVYVGDRVVFAFTSAAVEAIRFRKTFDDQIVEEIFANGLWIKVSLLRKTGPSTWEILTGSDGGRL